MIKTILPFIVGLLLWGQSAISFATVCVETSVLPENQAAVATMIASKFGLNPLEYKLISYGECGGLQTPTMSATVQYTLYGGTSEVNLSDGLAFSSSGSSMKKCVNTPDVIAFMDVKLNMCQAQNLLKDCRIVPNPKIPGALMRVCTNVLAYRRLQCLSKNFVTNTVRSLCIINDQHMGSSGSLFQAN